MSQQFKEQGGAATMDPTPLQRWLTSRLAMLMNSEGRFEKRRKKAERVRQKEGRRHVVDYFHQAEDGYSYLAAQVLSQLAERYDVELRCHLVRGPEGKNAPDAALLLKLSRYDASLIASEYGLDFPVNAEDPTSENIRLASSISASVKSEDMAEVLPRIGQALWRNDSTALESLAESYGHATDSDVEALLDAGTELRAQLKHYSGAMFYYEGEWYWGVDRLYHLEARLKSLGADKSPDQPPLYPRPSNTVSGDASALTLEYYPSLRSPYTAVSWEPTMKLARESGINLEIKPVLPMVMRGVPATRQKGIYIFKDAAREARAQGIIYGKFYDPIGDPVLKGYALYAWAKTTGKGNDLLGSFLNAAFAEGINTNSNHGLRHIVEKAGLDWQEARNHLNDTEWHSELEQNRLSMYGFGSWGVPSYQLLDANGESVLAVWGQDRLWLVAKSIVDLITNKAERQF